MFKIGIGSSFEGQKKDLPFVTCHFSFVIFHLVMEPPPEGVEKAVQAATSSRLMLSVSTLFKRTPSAYCIPL
jgi:hypothetical protein